MGEAALVGPDREVLAHVVDDRREEAVDPGKTALDRRAHREVDRRRVDLVAQQDHAGVDAELLDREVGDRVAEAVDQGVEALGDPRVAGRRIGAATFGLESGQVTAGAEGPLACTRHHANVQGGIFGKAVERLIQRHVHFRRERVHLLRAIDRDPEDSVRRSRDDKVARHPILLRLRAIGQIHPLDNGCRLPDKDRQRTRQRAENEKMGGGLDELPG